MKFSKVRSNEEQKADAELQFWVEMVRELTASCNTETEKRGALLRVCHEMTFPRYKRDLYVTDNSFAGKRILDVGCGPHCGIIGFTGSEKYGVDHLIEDYKRIGYPLDDHGVQYRNAKSEDIPFNDNFFDVVLCVNALDHVDNLNQTISEITRALKPGGSFLAQLNFHTTPTPTEPICLTHSQLACLFEEHGLQIGSIKYQYTLDDGHEDRYYYEAWKGGKRVSESQFALELMHHE